MSDDAVSAPPAAPRSPNEVRREAVIALARAHLGQGRALTLVTEGHSMWPLLCHGDTVEVRPLAGAEPVVGDIVLVTLGGRLVLHRVVARAGAHIVTKGDAVPVPDPPLTRDDVMGALALPLPLVQRALATVSLHGARPLAGALQRLRLALARRPV